MASFKCKICGGSLEIDNAQSVATCEYCGTKQTLPKLDNEHRANLYDRANHFRRNNDFDKAMGIYENILNGDNTDAEAYWSIVLCRYGIEYVEDPTTRKRVPTINRAQFTSIFDDEDYKSAIANADGYQREIYEVEAAAINEIQKGILAISQKEEPFDIFICYKETDTRGRRTQDSVLATELYHELTREGFKVFFSRITLEDKLGVAYEPYIFAALHSAKVMVVLGTNSEHFNAVWVKNEWSRFLALIKNGAKKTLIPAYRDMDPYDLPEEFSHLQAQDMSKLGFMQDLTRGIKKIVEAGAPKETVKETIVATAAAINVAPLLKRAFMFLEDGDFDRADDFCEQVLNQDPENAQAYLGKLMAELRVRYQSDLMDCQEPFDDNKNYQKAVRFADEQFAKQLRGYVAHINERNTMTIYNTKYDNAVLWMKSARSAKDYQVAGALFNEIMNFKDSGPLAKICFAKFNEIEEKERVEAQRKAEEQRIAYEKVLREKHIQEELSQEKAKKRAKRNKKIAMIVSIVLILGVAFYMTLILLIIPNKKYNEAVYCMNNGEYEKAIIILETLDQFKNSKDVQRDCEYQLAMQKFDLQNYESAYEIFERLGNYHDSDEMMQKSAKNAGDIALSNNYYKMAITWYSRAGDFESRNNAKYQYIKSHMNAQDVDTYEYLSTLKNINYKDASDIYSQLYTLKFEFVVNDSPTDYTTHKSKFQYIPGQHMGGYIYIHFRISGGYPGQNMAVCFNGWQSGYSQVKCNGEWNTFIDGRFLGYDATSSKTTIKIYQGTSSYNNSNIMGECTVTVYK